MLTYLSALCIITVMVRGEVQTRMQFAVEGDTVKLTCPVKNLIPGMKVIWFRIWTTGEFSVKQGYDGYSRMHQGHILVIENVKKSNGAFYKCRKLYESRFRDYVMYYNLTILDRPNIQAGKPEFSDLTTVENNWYRINTAGERITFDCKANGTSPMTYTWYRHGWKICHGNEYVEMTGSKLVIKNSIVQDSGEFSCLVSNTIGEVEAKFKLAIGEKPMINKLDFNDMTVDPNKYAQIPCYAFSKTFFRFIFWKDRQPNVTVIRTLMEYSRESPPRLNIRVYSGFDVKAKTKSPYPGIVLYGGALSLYKVKKEDAGYYTCISSTLYGYDYVHMKLSVQEGIAQS